MGDLSETTFDNVIAELNKITGKRRKGELLAHFTGILASFGEFKRLNHVLFLYASRIDDEWFYPVVKWYAAFGLRGELNKKWFKKFIDKQNSNWSTKSAHNKVQFRTLSYFLPVLTAAIQTQRLNGESVTELANLLKVVYETANNIRRQTHSFDRNWFDGFYDEEWAENVTGKEQWFQSAYAELKRSLAVKNLKKPGA